MITSVSSVLVANTACPSSYSDIDSLNDGEIALFDENKQVITSADDAADAAAVYVGVCRGTMEVVNPSTQELETKAMIEFSHKIEKNRISYVFQAYSAPVQEVLTFDFSSATIVVGHRYVLRIVYKDLYEHPGQFTHTYETIAESDSASDLCDAFAKLINKHPGRRVNVSSASGVLTLTAKEKNDNEGVYPINEYTIVNMEGVVYTTIPGALLSNIPDSVPGLEITKTDGDPGKGYWKQVRDREMRTAGYKGEVMIDAYPATLPKRYVQENGEYDYVIVENYNKYLSPDNQYVKSTPMMTEVYVTSGSLESSAFMTYLKAFVTGTTE